MKTTKLVEMNLEVKVKTMEKSQMMNKVRTMTREWKRTKPSPEEEEEGRVAGQANSKSQRQH